MAQIAPETLHQLILHNGLDVCAEIVAAATPAQLASVLDLDLWRSSRPGLDERFDPARFGEWLELLVDAGDAVAARIVAAMDDHLVVAGLSRYIRVLDPAATVTIVEGEPADINHHLPSHGGPDCEVGGYLVHGITADCWDAIVALLLALEAGHPDRFHAVMGKCRRLSNSTPEVDGLDDLLMEPEQWLHDLTLDREDRRARQGYGTPADARAFLLMARRRRPPSNDEPPVNPLVAAYFRAVDDSAAPAALSDIPRTQERLADILATLSGVDLIPQRPRALLGGTQDQPSGVALVRTLLQYVRDHDEALYFARTRELAFLANALAAGCSIQSRPFTPQEAADAAMGTCNLGLEHSGATVPDRFLMEHGLVAAFEAGWAVLHEEVIMFTARELVAALSNLQCSDPDIQEGLNTLRIELASGRQAGTPWHARKALDVIGMLDMPAWASLMGLLDECPVIPAALTATLDRRSGAVSASDFEFICTRGQLARVREFMARFLDILQG